MIITTVLQLLVDRIDLGLSLPQAIADPRASQRNTPRERGARVHRPSRCSGAERARASLHPVAEIGAATGIEFLSGGGVLAAAEPMRRGGGSAMVVSP